MSEQPRSGCQAQNRAFAMFTGKARPVCLGYVYICERKKRDNNPDLKQGVMQKLLTGRTCLDE